MSEELCGYCVRPASAALQLDPAWRPAPNLTRIGRPLPDGGNPTHADAGEPFIQHAIELRQTSLPPAHRKCLGGRNGGKKSYCLIKLFNFNALSARSGGEGGIRTLGTHKGTTVFETAPIDRSGTSPWARSLRVLVGRVAAVAGLIRAGRAARNQACRSCR